jgi:acyl carrier protein
MALFLDVPPERLTDGAQLSEVVAESFLLVQLVVELQDALGVRVGAEELRGVRTVGDLVGVFEKAPEATPR